MNVTRRLRDDGQYVLSKSRFQRAATQAVAGRCDGTSGSNLQPWEFIVIDDEKIIAQIAELKYLQSLKMTIDAMVLNNRNHWENTLSDSVDPLQHKWLRQRSAYQKCAVVAICNKKRTRHRRKPLDERWEHASTWMCIENMALQLPKTIWDANLHFTRGI